MPDAPPLPSNKEIFDQFDVNGNGLLEREELADAILEVYKSQGKAWMAKYAEKLWHLADGALLKFAIHNPGKGLDFGEFQRMITTESPWTALSASTKLPQHQQYAHDYEDIRGLHNARGAADQSRAPEHLLWADADCFHASQTFSKAFVDGDTVLRNKVPHHDEEKYYDDTAGAVYDPRHGSLMYGEYGSSITDKIVREDRWHRLVNMQSDEDLGGFHEEMPVSMGTKELIKAGIVRTMMDNKPVSTPTREHIKYGIVKTRVDNDLKWETKQTLTNSMAKRIAADTVNRAKEEAAQIRKQYCDAIDSEARAALEAGLVLDYADGSHAVSAPKPQGPTAAEIEAKISKDTQDTIKTGIVRTQMDNKPVSSDTRDSIKEGFVRKRLEGGNVSASTQNAVKARLRLACDW